MAGGTCMKTRIYRLCLMSSSYRDLYTIHEKKKRKKNRDKERSDGSWEWIDWRRRLHQAKGGRCWFSHILFLGIILVAFTYSKCCCCALWPLSLNVLTSPLSSITRPLLISLGGHRNAPCENIDCDDSPSVSFSFVCKRDGMIKQEPAAKSNSFDISKMCENVRENSIREKNSTEMEGLWHIERIDNAAKKKKKNSFFFLSLIFFFFFWCRIQKITGRAKEDFPCSWLDDDRQLIKCFSHSGHTRTRNSWNKQHAVVQFEQEI